MGLELEASAVDRLMSLMRLLAKWNRVYNLTSLATEEKWVSHHLLDSLSIIRHLPIGRMIDVGTGGGFPGLPVAIAEPRREVVLLDSNQKKTAFVRQAATELGLTNVSVETSRVESFLPTQRFDVVVSRAFASLEQYYQAAAHLCKEGGLLVAMKGAMPVDEIAALPTGTLREAFRVEVPMIDGERHLVLLNPPGAVKD